MLLILITLYFDRNLHYTIIFCSDIPAAGEVAEEAVEGGDKGYGASDIAYVGHKAIVACNAADKSPGTDTEIEYTRVDTHRHGGIMGREHDNLILERDIIDSDGETPQYAQHGHQPDAQ